MAAGQAVRSLLEARLKKMDRLDEPELPVELPVAPEAPPPPSLSLMRRWGYPLMVVAAFMVGLLMSNLIWGRGTTQNVAHAQAPGTKGPSQEQASSQLPQQPDAYAALIDEVNPPEGYKLPVSYGDLGPKLIESGAIDYDKFAEVYTSGGDPLSAEQVQILKAGSDVPVVINSANAHFLLNFFWAVGLANQNTILTEGPITQYSEGKIDGFASTGGWTLGAKPVTEIFAATKLIELTPEQQARVEQVAANVYRPCCDNPTLFPDCNHGMAMLGLLELMASKNASVDEMFTAAKYVNAFWFPQQAIETAIYFRVAEKVDFVAADPRKVTGRELSSGSGSGQLHQQLEAKGLLPQAPGGGGGCGT